MTSKPLHNFTKKKILPTFLITKKTFHFKTFKSYNFPYHSQQHHHYQKYQFPPNHKTIHSHYHNNQTYNKTTHHHKTLKYNYSHYPPLQQTPNHLSQYLSKISSLLKINHKNQNKTKNHHTY